MQAARRWVEAVVAGDLLSRECMRCAGRGVEERTSPFEIFSYVLKFCIGCHRICFVRNVTFLVGICEVARLEIGQNLAGLLDIFIHLFDKLFDGIECDLFPESFYKLQAKPLRIQIPVKV